MPAVFALLSALIHSLFSHCRFWLPDAEASGPSPRSLLDGGASTAMRISHELPGCNWLEEKIKKAKVVANSVANATAAAAAGGSAATGSNGAALSGGDGQKVKNSTKRKEDSQPTQPLKSKSDGGGR